MAVKHVISELNLTLHEILVVQLIIKVKHLIEGNGKVRLDW